MSKRQKYSRVRKDRRHSQPAQPEESFFQPWMILLVFPLVGALGLVFVLAGGGNDSSPNGNDESIRIEDNGTPEAQTLAPRTPEPTSTSVFGNPPPDVVLTDLEGNPFTLADYAGKPLVVNFWATWCPPCRAEMPELQRYSEENSDVTILLVTDPTSGQSVEEIRQFIAEYGITMRVGLDTNSQLQAAMGLQGLPSTYFLDDQSRVKGRRVGQVTYDDLVDEVSLLQAGS
ncbi:MAG: TlpA family protein disulfide reductase [Chloroflexi bacterium]|nr:TlpA family protein disulfide reductase [Chloroflexota bacterium]